MKINLVAIDLAKLVFQVCAIDARRKVSSNRKLSRGKFTEWLKDLEPTTIAMEACASAHYWGRRLQAMGHRVLLVPAQHVKAFCRVHKSDRGDALAIAEATHRPDMHFVPVKTIGQQDLQLLGRIRGKLVAQRTESINQIRGFAGEYGVIFAKSRRALMAALPTALEDAENGLSFVARRVLNDLLQDVRGLDAQISAVMAQLTELAQQEPAYARLLSVPGFGPVIAPAFIAAIGSGKQFNSGRDVSAWLGLVPRQNGTGGKVSLQRITKNGDRELRVGMIHGARAVLRWAHRHDHAQSRWLLDLKARRGAHRTIVALANKLTRIGWAVLTSDTAYDPSRAFKPRTPKPPLAATA